MENSRLRQAPSTSVNVTVGKRSREYLADREVERLIEAAKQNRSGHRDATAILVAYRHGLRASELVALRWDDIESARESRALRKLLREAPTSPYVFISERNAPLSVAGISAHGCQGGRGGEIHVPRAFPHAAACLRVQARQRRPRHSRHPSLSRAPIDHVHGALHGLDAEPVQKLLEGLTFQASIKRRRTAAMPITRHSSACRGKARVAVATTSVTASQRNGPADVRFTAESGHSGTRSATKSRSVSLPAVSAATLKWAGTGGGNRANSTQVTNQAVH
jgi:integrase